MTEHTATELTYIQYIYQIAESAKYYAVMQIYICIIINKQTDMGNMTHCMTLLQQMWQLPYILLFISQMHASIKYCNVCLDLQLLDIHHGSKDCHSTGPYFAVMQFLPFSTLFSFFDIIKETDMVCASLYHAVTKLVLKLGGFICSESHF